jgi:hypothetical protein
MLRQLVLTAKRTMPRRTTQTAVLTKELRLENRLLFATEGVLSEVADMYPVDRLAGRGLDGNTHAPLISLADRPPSGH